MLFQNLEERSWVDIFFDSLLGSNQSPEYERDNLDQDWQIAGDESSLLADFLNTVLLKHHQAY